MVSPAVSKTLRYLAGIQDDEEPKEPGLLDSLGQGIQGIGSGISQGISDAGSAIGQGVRDVGTGISSAVSSAASAVSDAYAVPTEQRPPQYSGLSYAQPSLAPGEQSTLERLPGMGSAAVEGAGAMLGDRGAMLAGLKPPQSAMDVIEQAAPAPVRGLQIGREALRAAGGAALEAAPQTTDPLFTTNEIQTPLGTIPSMTGPTPQQAGRFVGEELADPTNYLNFGAAGRAADAPVGEVLGAVGRRVRGALAGNAERMAAADARMAAEGSTAAPGVFGLSGIEPDQPAVRGMRPRIIPEDVADQLDYPVKPPTDPATIRAIEAAGGTVDERGTTLNVIRMSDPEAAGGAATRSMVFYTAGPPGAPSEYARTGTVGPQGVGGQQRIEGRTRFRNPLFISDAPGEARGFDDAMRQMGAVEHPDMRAAKRVMEDAHDAERAAYEQRHDAMQRWYDAHPRWAEEEADAFRASPAYDRLTQDLAGAGNAHDEARAAVRAIRDTHPEATAETVEDGIREAKRAGSAGSPERAAALKDLVSRYGGDPDVIDDLIELRGAEMGESVYAVKENIVAGNARRAGHDGVIAIKASGGASAEELVAHPAVVEAKAALTRASEALDVADDAHQATPNNANWRAVVEANRRVEAAEKAWATAKRQAFEELASRRQITELADPREARNPTPGQLTPESRKADIAFRARQNELEQAVRNASMYSQDEIAALRTARDQARAERDRVGGQFATPPGYTLRPDIPARPGTPEAARRAAEAAEEAAHQARLDAAFNHPDVQEAGQRVQAAEEAYQAARARWQAGDMADRSELDAAFDARGQAIAEHARLQREAFQAGSATAQASAGALPAEQGPRIGADRFGTVNRALSQGVVSSVSGGVGAQVNQELNPDDPQAFGKGFVVGAAGPVLAQRGARGLARLAGARGAEEAGGARIALGDVPPSKVRQPGLPGMEPAPPRPIGEVRADLATDVTLPSIPGAQQALTAAQQRAASMQARGVQPLGPLEMARKATAQIGYSSMIGPTTFTTSMLGGPLEMAWSVPKRLLGAALPKGLGGRAVPAEALAIARGGVTGLGEVGGAIVDALKGTGRYAATPGHEPLSAQIVNPIGHAAASALEAGGRFWSGVPDAIYGTIGRKMGEARAAAEAATDAGLTGAAWRQHVDDLLADVQQVQGGQLPTMSATQDVITAGEKAGKRSTYQDDLGAIGQNVKDVATLAVIPDGKGGRKPVPIVGNMIAPFFNTPWNMEARLAEKIPGVGAAMTTQKGFDKAYDQVMGTALVAGMGGYAASGNITGSGPDDPEKRKMLQAQGWRQYSTNIGGYYIPNRALGEFGPLLNAVGDAHDSVVYSEDKDFPAVASNFGARIGKQMQERVWLQGLSELIGALEAGQQGGLGAGAERYAASLATRMVPYAATARTIGTALDPQARTTDRGKETTVGQRIGQQVQRGLGLGQGAPSLGIAPLPVEQDVLGRPQANPQQGAGALFPRVGFEKPEPISKAYLEGGVDIGGPPPTIGGIALTPAQQRRWNAARGQALQQARADILAARTLPKADRQAELRRILSEASADARDTVEPTFTERQRRDAERKAS